MKRRFTAKSRTTRGSIPESMRNDVYHRDNFTCQFCQAKFDRKDLTIDHLIPLALGGLDEVTNYVTCCGPCNSRKSDLPLAKFAGEINIDIRALPVHGDSVIDNDKLPIQIRLVRKNIFDRMRQGDLRIGGKSAQKKLEKEYRREFWKTEVGRQLMREQPQLPGHVRIMVPEIITVAKNAREYILLVELAKSAHTRDLIGTVLSQDVSVEDKVHSLANRNKNLVLEKRLKWAIQRSNREVRRRALG